MSDYIVKPLRQVYVEDSESCHSLIVKHFPLKWREIDVQKFITSVTRTEVDIVCIPEAHCDMAVAVLPPTQIVYDTQVQRWQERAFRRPAEDCFPIFELLGEPSGLFIADVPAGICFDTLALYFENGRSGGIEGTVEEPVEKGDIADKKYAVIKINDKQAIRSILSIEHHQLNGDALEISPFYPTVHRYVLETLKNRGSEGESCSKANAEPDVTDECSSILYDNDLTDSELSRSCEQETDIKEDIVYPENTRIPINNGIETSKSEDRSAVSKKRFFSGDENRIVGTVRPLVRETTHHGNGDDNSFEKPEVIKRSFTEEAVDLPPYKIELLIKYRFKETHESETLKIIVKQEEENVNFRWLSFEEFKTVRNKMLSCFDDICSKVVKLDVSKYRLLSSDTNMTWIRSKFESNNIRVSLVTDDTKQEIICYSLNDSDADKGITLIREYIVSKTIVIKEDKQNLVHCQEWFTLKQSLEDDKMSVSISQDGKTICIDSLDENKAGEAMIKVNKYLSKQSVVKKAATVHLESGKARFFKESIEGRLRHDIEKRNGSLCVEEKSRDPLKLQVSCEGSDDVTVLLTKAVQGIWHESVDFNKLTTAAEDTGLIMKALDGQEGKLIVSKFEKNQNCCVEISKKGEKVIQKPRIVVKDVFDSSDEESGAAAASNELIPEVGDEQSQRSFSARGRDRWKHKGDRFVAYKSGLTEEDELKKALELSMERTSSTSPVPEVSAESDSDSVLSEDTIFSDGSKEDKTQDGVLYDRVRQNTDDCRPKERRDNPLGKSITMSGTTIKLAKGAIAKQKADVLVNVVSQSQNPFDGVIARSFLDIGGKDLMKMYNDGEHAADDDLVITKSSGLLQCSSVIHVKLTKSDDFGKIVKRVVSDVLSNCQRLGAKDIAFPPIGVGRMFKYKPEQVAQAMLSEIRVQLSTRITGVKNISIVIFGDDIYQIFQKELKAVDRREHDHRRKPSVDDGCYRRKNQNQQQHRERPYHDRHAHTASHHHRGARSSSNSSSNSRESSDRRKQHSFDRKGGDGHGRHQRQDSQPSTEKCTVPDLSVRIIAENKEACINAVKAFCTKVKDKFLHEEIVNNTQKISRSSKNKIVHIISANDVICIKGKDNHKLKGMKRNVNKAHSEILKVLLEEKEEEKKDDKRRRKKKHKTERETVEFVQVMCEEEPEVPNYWKDYKEGETIVQSFKRFVGKKCEKVELDKGSRQFKCIVKMMKETFDPSLVGVGKDAFGLQLIGYDSLFVLKIERIENFVLYEKFVKRRQNLYHKLLRSREARFPKLEQIPQCSGPVVTSKYVQHHLDGDLHPEINEYLLFHSTKKERVNVICNDGFDPRLGSGQAMFGPGIYGAEKASKADQYADDPLNRTKGPLKMFLIRMLLGNGYLCTAPNPHKYRRPPCTRCVRDDCIKHFHTNGKFGHFYDSVIGDNKKLFREFVVYEDSLCYPEYLITYERR